MSNNKGNFKLFAAVRVGSNPLSTFWTAAISGNYNNIERADLKRPSLPELIRTIKFNTNIIIFNFFSEKARD